MPAPLDLAGKTFGRFTEIRVAPKRSTRERRRWECRCVCGNTRTVAADKLVSGNTQSCGCFRREFSGNKARSHGMSKTPEYNISLHIKKRCLDPNNPAWKWYGGRGITVCQEWID